MGRPSGIATIIKTTTKLIVFGSCPKNA